jgi:hypothetical protein
MEVKGWMMIVRKKKRMNIDIVVEGRGMNLGV